MQGDPNPGVLALGGLHCRGDGRAGGEEPDRLRVRGRASLPRLPQHAAVRPRTGGRAAAGSGGLRPLARTGRPARRPTGRRLAQAVGRRARRRPHRGARPGLPRDAPAHDRRPDAGTAAFRRRASPRSTSSWPRTTGTCASNAPPAGFRTRFTARPTHPISLLGNVAEAAADLLGAKKPELIRRCGNPDCVLFFYDATRNHRRQWCAMGTCGNLMKVRAFRRRHRRRPQA